MENLANYGDSSAVMGNDAAVRNSFTAMVRFKLGWLPNSEIQQDLSAPIRLAALTLGPKDAVAGESDIYLAASTPCSNCVTKILNSDGTPKSYDKGGYLWITFRGDGDECSPESSYCHVDHNQYYNQVFVHWQQPGSLTTERWYYMSPGESYQPPGSGLTVSVCAIEGDVAKVAITPATCNSAAELKTLIAKARKVLKKAHASGSLQAR